MKTDAKKLIGQILELRRQLGLTQMETAALLETGQTWVSDLENGKKTPHVLTLEGALARLLAVQESSLSEGGE